jgi:hypothetical protein
MILGRFKSFVLEEFDSKRFADAFLRISVILKELEREIRERAVESRKQVVEGKEPIAFGEGMGNLEGSIQELVVSPQ